MYTHIALIFGHKLSKNNIKLRLFQYKNNKWNKVYDVKRAYVYGDDNTNTQKGDFINNTGTNNIAGEQVPERQSLSKALRPKADN